MPHPPGRRIAFTLLEIMFAVTIVTGALVGLFSAILHVSRLNATNRENLAAMRAAEGMIETLRNTEFARIFPSFNSTPADDPPPGPGTAPGPDFDVEDLLPQADDGDHKCGRVLFPTDSSGAQLREDQKDPDLRMPMDLNGNGTIDHDDVSATCRMLPVAIRIDWQGVQGRRSWTYRTILFQRN